jgi:hypothetical protein
MPVVPVVLKAIGRRIVVYDCTGQKYKSLSEKQLTQKWIGGVAQVVETLISKCEALSSDFSTVKIITCITKFFHLKINEASFFVTAV